MEDLETVCCMCGDVGFSDKLFRCNMCHDRFQHSYCSSYYREQAEQVEVCDWCESEARRRNRTRQYRAAAGGSQRDRTERNTNIPPPTESNNKIVRGILPPLRPTTRRYKLLKDVMC